MCQAWCNGKEDLKHLECIFEEDVQANDIRYFCDLSAVTQTDFVDKGMCCCASMIIAFGFAFGIRPNQASTSERV
jgi:hypothetical protein